MSKNEGDENRLPVRWALIIGMAVGIGMMAGGLAGPAVGVGAGLAAVSVFFKVIGH